MKLTEIIQKYFLYRNYKTPDKNQSMLFLASEVGELADAVVRDQADWVRNKPLDHPISDKAVESEIADVLMMLCAVAQCYGVDPMDCLVEKMLSKGFPVSIKKYS